VDLDAFGTGPLVDSYLDDFDSMFDSSTTGSLDSRVFFDGTTYVYTQTVTSEGDFNLLFNTDFSVPGFGAAGWSFSDAASAGGTGTAGDFRIERTGDNQLFWVAMPGGAFGNWNAFEPITFFFTSTLPPTIQNYTLVSLLPFEIGSAQGLAPVPEPGSIALFGSGLVGLYAAIRRRRAARL
jgi:hypothetical protein